LRDARSLHDILVSVLLEELRTDTAFVRLLETRDVLLRFSHVGLAFCARDDGAALRDADLLAVARLETDAGGFAGLGIERHDVRDSDGRGLLLNAAGRLTRGAY